MSLESVRLDLGLEVLDHMLNDGANAFGVLDQHGHLGGPFGQVIAVLFAEVAGDLLVRFVDRCPVDLQPDLRRLEIQRQRGPVADRVLERVAAEVPAFVLVGAEGPERVAVGAVDGRAASRIRRSRRTRSDSSAAICSRACLRRANWSGVNPRWD